MKKTFLHLSDIHFRREYPNIQEGYDSIFHKMSSPLVRLDECFRLVPVESLDFVLISGDLTENGNAGDYEILRDFFDHKLNGTPLCVTLGNHDNKPEFYRGWLNALESKAPFNQIINIGRFHVISFDNSSPPEYPNGTVSESQTVWLRDALKKVEGSPCILITHHHLRSDQSDIPPAVFEESFVELVRQSVLQAIFCGHTHHSYCGRFAGKPYFTAGGISFAAETIGDCVVFYESSSVHLCQWSEEGISVQNIPILQKGRELCTLFPQAIRQNG